MPDFIPNYKCRECGVDHGDPELSHASLVCILVGPHKGRIGVVTEWRRYNGPTWVRVVMGMDERDEEILVNFSPCQLEKFWSAYV